MKKYNIQNLISKKEQIDWTQPGFIVTGFTKRPYVELYIYRNATNCKLITIEYLSSLFSEKPTEKTVEEFNTLLGICNTLVFFTHVAYDACLKNLSTYFKNYYITEVPIGYGGRFQYHALFLSNNTIYGGYNEYLDRFNKSKEYSIAQKEVIIEKQPLINTDQVILDFVGKATNEELTKLRSYKQKKRQTDLLTEIRQR